MNLKLRTIVAASLGLSCSMGASTILNPKSPVPVQTSTGGVTVTGNGLNPAVYNRYIGNIMGLMNERLTDGQGHLSSNWASIINARSGKSIEPPTGSPCQRQDLVRHLIACALPPGVSVTYDGPLGPLGPNGPNDQCPSGTTWQGQGLLTSPGGRTLYEKWDQPSPVLTPQDKQAILTCMATRMNFIEGVNFVMEGERVLPKCGSILSPSGEAAFPVEEGYWSVLPDAGKIYYWPPESAWGSPPRGPLVPGKSLPIIAPIQLDRGCSDPSNLCNLAVGAGACTFEGDGWTCHTGGTPDSVVPAFATRLTCFDCCADAGYNIDCAAYSDGGCVCGAGQMAPWADAGVCP